jgi:hypothetical protein
MGEYSLWRWGNTLLLVARHEAQKKTPIQGMYRGCVCSAGYALTLIFSTLVDFNQSFANGVFYQVGQAL